MKKLFIALPFVFVSLASYLFGQEPFAIPTYHCLGIYWSPDGGNSSQDVLVAYRPLGEAEWKEGLNMVYHPVSGTTVDKADYRGSLVNLMPNSTYEIRLTLEGEEESEVFSATTWSEVYPEGKVTKIGSQNLPLWILKSGQADAYLVYDGKGDTIDVQHAHDFCIAVNASYVILRNFTLRGTGDTSEVATWPPIGVINIVDGSNIIIEDCDIADWGRPHADPSVPNQGNNYESAILSRNKDVSKVTIQRNKMHHPLYQSNSWKDGLHPQGPQCIGFWDSKGNHVIRYNECWSDKDHYFNDIIGAGENASYEGFPGDDSDIYGNYFANGWDDGIESEGANQNVRIWNNYITSTLMAIGNAATSVGPLYIWKNVADSSYTPPPYSTYGNFMKMGYAVNISWMTGTMYVFHNTIYQEGDMGYDGLGGWNRVIKHCVSRNNILSVRSTATRSIALASERENNDLDYDLYNKNVPSESEANGISGLPTYLAGSGLDWNTKTGSFQLDPGSLGYDQGVVIPNFNDGYTGAAPDVGAHENGTEAFVYGVNASFLPQDVTSSRSKPSLNYKIRVFPNPSDGNVIFESDDLMDSIIKLTDTAGRVVRTTAAHAQKVVMLRENLSPGIYTYQILRKGEQIYSGQLIMQ